MKRFFDITVTAVLLLLLVPVLALLAVAVWLDEPGPIIYRGPRVGRSGQPFHILKFRSMTLKPVAAREITVCDDPRVTRVGRILRATKLDELPQLINVLLGDMSLVGPRPESPHFVAHYTPQQKAVLNVRPGITGAAQIVYRHEEQLLDGSDPEAYYLTNIMPAKLAIDLDYVKNRTFWLDVRIIILTLLALVRPVSQIALGSQKVP